MWREAHEALSHDTVEALYNIIPRLFYGQEIAWLGRVSRLMATRSEHTFDALQAGFCSYASTLAFYSNIEKRLKSVILTWVIVIPFRPLRVASECIGHT